MLEQLRKRKWSRRDKFLALSAVPVYFLMAGFLIQPAGEIWAGIIQIIKEPDFLITDYMAVGGIGAALVNAGTLMLVCNGIVYALGMEMDGRTVTASFLMFGFSLFGKNLVNIWSILIGVYLYARYHKAPLTQYIYVGFYGTSLSPLITQVMQLSAFGPGAGLLASCLLGIIIGFVLPPLSAHVFYAHKGYSLYNVGFAGGIIATVIVSLMKSFGMETKSRLVWYTGSNGLFIVLLSVLFGGMAVVGFLMEGKALKTGYGNVIKSSGAAGTDYLKEAGGWVTLLNMGINGLFATAFIAAVGGDLNGPTIGGIMTIVGFGATGKHIRNIIPVMAGVYLASIMKVWKITDPSALLALLFSTTLAPVAGEFGVAAGIVAGYLHSSVALNVGIVYGGMNLYNNGFAGGIVAIFLVPVILSIRSRKIRARGGISS